MENSLITLTAAAVMLYGASLGRAADFGDGSFDSLNKRTTRPLYNGYEQYSGPDVISELQHNNKVQKMNEAAKDLPAEDPLQARRNKRLESISSTNFTADTNRPPIEIVPGLSGGTNSSAIPDELLPH
jgi:hypothetical protein